MKAIQYNAFGNAAVIAVADYQRNPQFVYICGESVNWGSVLIDRALFYLTGENIPGSKARIKRAHAMVVARIEKFTIF